MTLPLRQCVLVVAVAELVAWFPGRLLDCELPGQSRVRPGSGLAFQSAPPLQNASARNTLAGRYQRFPSMCLKVTSLPASTCPVVGKLHFQLSMVTRTSCISFRLSRAVLPLRAISPVRFTSGAPGHLEEHILQSELTPLIPTLCT